MAARRSAAERRAAVVDAAVVEFATRGLEATSTDDIARRAGISQPYVFRLFGTKKALFRAATERAFRGQLELFERAAKGKRGEDALQAIGEAFLDELTTEPTLIVGQMHAYAACDDPDIREVVRDGYGELVACVQRASGLPAARISGFFAAATLSSVLASIRARDTAGDWPARLLDACVATLTGPPPLPPATTDASGASHGNPS